jgi:hypothetical protein
VSVPNLDRVHDEIGEPRDCSLPAAVDRGAFAVDGDEVRFEVAFGGGGHGLLVRVRSCIFGIWDEKGREGKGGCIKRRTQSLPRPP